eukprot:m.41152 g.41152  ORF g.41152 m.41152 type:complete len:59 (-) comp11788_c0_seq1:1627-1803(-)
MQGLVCAHHASHPLFDCDFIQQKAQQQLEAAAVRQKQLEQAVAQANEKTEKVKSSSHQ